jgi:peptidoglycan/xylan/chitin deacetylase (PgdA/CDA1 family)
MPGIFNISLDFELHWGRFDKMTLDAQDSRTYFLNTRALFPQLIELFTRYQIHVTWATVGMLYNRNAAEWEQHKPALLPTYNRRAVSSYAWSVDNGFMEPEDPFHFAPQLIGLFENNSLFETATHTYSHYYCQEPGQTPEQFRADLSMAITVASKRGHTLRSLVFPRNQFNASYLTVCAELGIETVRSNPPVWYWDANTPETILKKVFRTGDAYSSLLGNKVVALDQIDLKQHPLQLPASRLYRAWTSKSSLLNQLKMRRILKEMTFAARTEGYYHLWWHPHNFGFHPKECLQELEVILRHYQKLQQQYGFQSLTMLETKQYLQERVGK